MAQKPTTANYPVDVTIRTTKNNIGELARIGAFYGKVTVESVSCPEVLEVSPDVSAITTDFEGFTVLPCKVEQVPRKYCSIRPPPAATWWDSWDKN